METVYENFVQHNLVTVEKTQVKAEPKAEMPEGAKRVLSVYTVPYLNPLSVAENDIIISGKTVTRMVYADELGKYDSAEQAVPFETKVFVKNIENYKGLQAAVKMTDKNALDIGIFGITERNIRFVSGLSGDAETKTEPTRLSSVGVPIIERFNVGDTIELDKSCEGVLGIDANASIRGIVCGENKVSVKGIIAVNVLGVKTGEKGSVTYNSNHIIDWTKTFSATGVTKNDLAAGNVSVTGKNIKIETGAMLNADIELAFNGVTYTDREIKRVIDAVSFSHELTFNFTDIEQSRPYPQINSYVDIENNINLPDGTPYIARVLSVDGVKIGAVNILPLDSKVTVEGVLSATVLWETEAGEVNTYNMELPISFSVRAEQVDADKSVDVAVTPVVLNVKARRGVELLIDARLSATVLVFASANTKISTDIVAGAGKQADDTAIHIHIVGDNETVWDIAKRTNITSAELIAGNPNLANGCTVGDKVVVYHHKKIQF